MPDIKEIYEQSKRQGGSGRGVSYWMVPAMCGRKRRLMDDNPAIETIGDRTALDVGTHYHFLKEMLYEGKLPDGLIFDADAVADQEWGEACRLFAWHREHFDAAYWGEVVAVELRMPINEEHGQKIKKFFGHAEATGALDLLVKMSAEDVSRIEQDRAIHLNGPGLYIVDHKTSGARKGDGDAARDYTSSLQCLTYMQMLGLAVNEPVRGMIFDVLVKHKVLRRHEEGRNGASVQTFFAKPAEEDAKIVRAAFDFARAQRDGNLANPFACFEYGRECVFLRQGLCGRY